eukprot:GFUD01020220.1.p1 GENE.GFUD01020220.1~~GFUD01020220.1.p1  ORF type:complete len:108 (+),score=6.55 GFUD01020220.1:331-654(+)
MASQLIFTVIPPICVFVTELFHWQVPRHLMETLTFNHCNISPMWYRISSLADPMASHGDLNLTATPPGSEEDGLGLPSVLCKVTGTLNSSPTTLTRQGLHHWGPLYT